MAAASTTDKAKAASEEVQCDAASAPALGDLHHFLLAADIGGTNSRLALYDRGKVNAGADPNTIDSDTNDDNGNDNGNDSGSGTNQEKREINNGNSFSFCKRPLFVREYRNEDHLLGGDTATVARNESDDDNDERPKRSQNQEKKTKKNSNSNSNNNVTNFVEAILGPFLEAAFESVAVAGMRVGGNHDTTSGSSRSSGNNIVVVCCLAIAGPVDPASNQGTVQTSMRDSYLTGLNGTGIVEDCQRQRGGEKKPFAALSCLKVCVVINDFVAQGYGCLSLDPEVSSKELLRLDGFGDGGSSNNENESPSRTKGPRLCVGAGTGFGSCYLVPTTTSTATMPSNKNDTASYTCLPSEYGQTDFAPTPCDAAPNRTGDQELLWKYLREDQQKRQQQKQQQPSRVSVEDVVSGTGLAKAYECFAALPETREIPEIREEFDAAGDLRGKVVGKHARDCGICRRALDTILLAYGSVVGSCAMAFLPSGGLYVTGGLLSNILKDHRENSGEDSSPPPLALFARAYRFKGRASFLLNDIPLYVVTARDTGLRGAAVRAEMEFQKYVSTSTSTEHQQG
mmetsp:Transcript_12205/g.25679  ORF Transcript_12205/g.25679 Transcript_12205/m.25679 type:complete len:569 (-) Transcript_12205:1753-3459(-)